MRPCIWELDFGAKEMICMITVRVLNQNPYSLLYVLEYFFDVFGQIVKFGVPREKRGGGNLLTSRGKTARVEKFR